MGYAAMEGRPGIVSVKKGWEDFNEVDRVVFDPEVISVPEMENILKAAGTYRKTLSTTGEINKRPEKK